MYRHMQKHSSTQYLSNFFFVLIIVLIIGNGVQRAAASDIDIVPSLNAKGEYDDNILFEGTNKVDDYIGIFESALELAYHTDIIDCAASAGMDLHYYTGNPYLNNENQRYAFKSTYRITQRIALGTDISYIKDTTLDTELQETGQVNTRGNRYRLNGVGTLSYAVSQQSDVTFGYYHQDTDYGVESNVDYNQNNLSASYSHQLRSEVDRLTVEALFGFSESTRTEIDQYGISIGWFHHFSETSRLHIRAGKQFSAERLLDERQTYEDWTWVGNVSFLISGEISSMNIAYRRSLRNSSSGVLIEVDRISYDLHHRIARRLNVGFRGAYYLSKSKAEINALDTNYMELIPYMRYQLTENHDFQINYGYSQEENRSSAAESKRERNRIFISVNLRFP